MNLPRVEDCTESWSFQEADWARRLIMLHPL